MSNFMRCYACMADMGVNATCPICGWQAGSEPDNSLYLPQGYLLNNRYTVGRVIGVGGFGIVYIAWDNNLDVRVAIKEFLAKDYAARSSDRVSLTPYTGGAREEHTIGVEKFLEEAKVLARFQEHPGIVTVHESFRTNNTAYMVMQFLDGMTLKEYLKRQPGEKISFNLAVKAMVPIMDALREVHAAGFVHRDISPDNIFITRQKQIKLLDFGTARYAIGEHSKSLTSVLKHGYAPVEQYSSKGNQGPWSDVYAVAATIYRCVTGQIPTDAMDRIQEDTIKSPKQLDVDIPVDGELALMKGLALKANARFENIQQFQQALITGEISTTAFQPTSSSACDLIEPSRHIERNFVECLECGAKNQLNPGDDPGALRCGKCKRELGIKPILSNVKGCGLQNVKHCPECGAEGDVFIECKEGGFSCGVCGATKSSIPEVSIDISKEVLDKNTKIFNYVKFDTSPHPWRRFWARTFDATLISLPVGYAFGYMFPEFTMSIMMHSQILSVMPEGLCPASMISDSYKAGFRPKPCRNDNLRTHQS